MLLSQICHATAASAGDEDTDFSYQALTVTVEAAAITGFSPGNAAGATIQANTGTQLTMAGTTATNDYVALLADSVAGCLGASSSPHVVTSGAVLNTGTSYGVGTYKVCFAEASTVAVGWMPAGTVGMAGANSSRIWAIARSACGTWTRALSGSSWVNANSAETNAAEALDCGQSRACFRSPMNVSSPDFAS